VRRTLAALPVTVVLLAGAVGCGSDDTAKAASEEPVPDAVPGVTVTGDFGKEPTIKVDDLDVDKPVDGVVITGDGPEVDEDSKLNYRYRIVYGSSGKEIATSFADDNPQHLEVAQQPDGVKDALVGSTVGSRVVIALPVEDFVGKGQASQFGLDAKDDLVMVLDIVSETAEALDGPEGDAVDPPADAPQVVEEDGAVTGLDFGSAPAKPSDELQVIPLVKGSGDPVGEGDTVTVDYYGAVYGESKAFDESYSAEPVSFPLAKGSLIDGWVQGLDGVTVGSRVMLVIPSELGYGAAGSGSTIPPDSTLVFVIDVLGANL
jgi:peptidylprolyl isomerase